MERAAGGREQRAAAGPKVEERASEGGKEGGRSREEVGRWRPS